MKKIQIINYSFKNIFELCPGSERIEKKILLSAGQNEFIQSEIKEIGFKKTFPKREVNSIYFDDERYNLAYDSINGVSKRMKFRLRFYNKGEHMRIEVKLKNNQIGRKLVIPIKENLDDLAKAIRYAQRMIFTIFNVYLKPVSQCNYIRNYFALDNGIRCTIDKKIISDRILQSTIYGGKNNTFNVAEFKYGMDLDNYFRRNIFRYFSKNNFRLSKSSKYLNCF